MPEYRDRGTEYTDQAYESLLRRFNRVYRQAQREIVQKLDAHTKRLNAVDEQKRAQLAAGKISKTSYDAWLRGQVYAGQLWHDKLQSVTSTLLDANRQANAMIEGERRAVFGENATFQAYLLEHGAGMDLSFTLYDSATVTRLIKEQPNLLPRREVDADKDQAWNQKKIANAITQGIIQGESIPEISQRIARDTGHANNAAMTRYARTAMTGAQNAGRLEVMRESQDMGIKVKKVWIATLDNRTRPAHQDLDGQVQDVNEPFDSILGPIMYPGDPNADEANTWNCRCTLGYDYEEYPSSGPRRDNESGEEIEDMTYDEWLEWKEEF